MKKILNNWLPVIIWMGFIFILSSISGLKSSFPDTWDIILRKLAHVTEFGILSFLFFRAVYLQFSKHNWKIFIVVGIISLLYAVSDEWHQGFVDDRVGALNDVLIDLVGIVIGLDIGRRVLIKLTQTKNPS
ncbi:MAG: VanZ family protein [bacterium]